MINELRRIGLMLGFIVAGATLSFAGPDDTQKPEDLARARLDVARRAYGQAEDAINLPATDESKVPQHLLTAMKVDQLIAWSRRWMEAERDSSGKKGDQTAALDAHRKRLKKWEDLYSELLEGGSNTGTALAVDTLKFHRLEAEYWMAKANGER